MSKQNSLLQALKVSRPGLWFPTLWIYLVPFQWEMAFWKEPVFWIGFVFVTFPLNYLVYGLNDLNDVAADAINPRKGNFLFGAKLQPEKFKGILQRIAIVTLPFIIYFSFLKGWKMVLLLLFMIAVNICYNFRPCRLKERPPFEIIIQVGYVFVAFFSVLLNDLDSLPWQTIVYLSLFAFQAHIAGEIMDIDPDLKSGKRTTATVLGRKKSKWLMFILLSIEVYVLLTWFQDIVLGVFLAVFSVWLLLDILIFFKDKPYTVTQMKFFGLGMNLCALGSMLWVLYSGTLTNPTF